MHLFMNKRDVVEQKQNRMLKNCKFFEIAHFCN